MQTALILGSNGQDGSYLADVLLERGWTVVGAALQETSRWVSHPRFHHRQTDVGNEGELTELLKKTRPLRIFAMSAIHGAAGFEYESRFRSALDVNVGSVHTCLEYLRREDLNARLFIASSMKVFGDNPPTVIDETTERRPTCLYGVTKNTAIELAQYYRRRHGVWASIGYLFNHDSPRRPPDYFLPRLAAQVAARVRGEPPPPPLNSLDFWCDWGSSLEFMGLAADMTELEEQVDLILASGRSHHAGDLALLLCQAAGVDASGFATGGDVRTDGLQGPPYRVSVERLSQLLGKPENDAFDVAAWILRERHGIALQRP